MRTPALIASVVLHAALFALLARHVALDMSIHGQAPLLQVTLVSPPNPSWAQRQAARHARRGGPVPPEAALPFQPPSPLPSDLDAAPSPSSGVVPEGAASDAPSPVTRGTLRGLAGCDRPSLTRQERDRCEADRWAGVAPVAPRLNLDPSGRYAKDPTPYLSRRPEKGCRVRLTGEVDARGDDENMRAGVTCVKRF